MISYAIRRIFFAVPTLFIALTCIFLVVRVLPGDPTAAILGDYISEEKVFILKHQLGLDRPLIVQYGEYLWNFCIGDFGYSLVTGTPVIKEIKAALPYSIELAIGGLLIGMLTGIPLGLLLAVKRNSWVDYWGRLFSLVGLSLPTFYTAVLLLLVFSIKMGWFPVLGIGEAGNFSDRMHHFILPSITLGLEMMAYLTRMTRSSMLDILNEDYVRTAHAKGLTRSVVIFKHAFKNASVPVVTVLGLYASNMIGASVLTEIIFNRPGLGTLIVGAMLKRDYITITSVLVVYSTIVVIINLITDLCYGFIDPRIRYE
jgi:ABC-type dipeptide/oligopeptide/nickel transport system permease component